MFWIIYIVGVIFSGALWLMQWGKFKREIINHYRKMGKTKLTLVDIVPQLFNLWEIVLIFIPFLNFLIGILFLLRLADEIIIVDLNEYDRNGKKIFKRSKRR